MELKKEMGDIKTELKMLLRLKKELNKTVQEAQEMQKKTVELTKTGERMKLMMQYKLTEMHLRFCSIPEQED